MPYHLTFNELTSVDSTNNYAMGMVHAAMAKHGEAWFAHEQTAGKGQRGRTWLGNPGENIALSIVLQPSFLKPGQQFMLSMAVALACYDVFSEIAGDEIKIKWPNDIYWRDRKAGGVLIENVIAGLQWKYAIVGIGLNVNQAVFDAALKNPVSLKQITGKEHDAVSIAKTIQQQVLKRFDLLENITAASLTAEYNSRLFGLNQNVRLKKDNFVFETLITGVDETGKLLTLDGMERSWDFGEVSWVF